MTRHLLVIGAQRCGTTYLHDLLAAHPQIAMARPARPEPKVFLSDELAGQGSDWYRSTYFAHATDELLLGEKSTSYLEYPEAAQRAVRVLGNPLVLVQLRDPVERAVSHWAFSTDAGLEQRSLTEALEANLEGPLPWDPGVTSVSPYAYLERGRYVEHLRPWLTAIGGDLRVLFLDELRLAPSTTSELFHWLGVDPELAPPQQEAPVNRSSQQPAELDPALHDRLRDYFRDSDLALIETLDRSLPWRTPDE